MTDRRLSEDVSDSERLKASVDSVSDYRQFESGLEGSSNVRDFEKDCIAADRLLKNVVKRSLKSHSTVLCYDEVNGFTEHGCTSSTANDLTSSWNDPTTSTAKHKKVTRSRSWCGGFGKSSHDGNGGDIRYLKERLLRTQTHLQPAAIRSFTTLQKTTLLTLALVDFMSFCSMSIMAPFFPREANEKGMSEAVSGFVFSFYALVMFIASPVFGKILPHVGAKFLFISGIFMAGSCNILFGFLEYIYDYKQFTIFCFLIRGFEALGASAYSTASFVFVINTFPNNIGSVLGILETFVGLGMSVGPAIGGLLYSIGGFGLPFYVLGVAMVVVMPINFYLLPSQNDFSIESRSGSIIELIKVPAVVVTSLVIIVVSNIWAFLDPTLEPHLRKFDLSVEQVGLIFLLFSGLYGLFSPIWGWLADRINRHWCMMVWGLLFCSTGLLLLGPSPLLPFLKSSLLLNIIGLSIVGISVALTLLPTFQGVLSSSIDEGGCSNNLATYSIVAGVWSCMYSLGEVIGPTLGGVLLKNYGFPICSTVMAGLTFTMAIVTFIFFVIKEATKLNCNTNSSIDSTKTAEISISSNSDEATVVNESKEEEPLIKEAETLTNYGGTSTAEHSVVDSHGKQNNSPDTRKLDYEYSHSYDNSYQHNTDSSFKVRSSKKRYLKKNYKDDCGNTIKVLYKKNGNGLPPKFCDSLLTKHVKGRNHSRNSFDDMLKYNIIKVNYYGQSRRDEDEELLLDRDQVTDVRGTVNVTAFGACEV